MKIEAAVLREGETRPAIESVDIEEPRDDEVLVRLVATGICHTDIEVASRPGQRPIVLGHEGAGIVEKVGPHVTEFEPGDHVILSGNSCGHCPSCLDNHPSYCVENMPRTFGALRMDGSSPLSKDGQPVFGRFFGQSSFATYSLTNQSTPVKAPKDLPLEMLGPLGCGVITGAGSVIEAFKLRAGQSIAIFGAGSVGLSAVMAARLVGAAHIIAVDLIPERLSLARELGATEAINPAESDPVAAIQEITRYGVDFSFNTTGVPAVYSQAMACLAHQGIAGFVTPPRGDWAPEIFPLLAGGRSLRGIIGGDASPRLFLPKLLDFHRQGRFPFDRLTTFYPFESIADAFADIGSGKTIKPVLRMPN